jgi:putative DNA primase/helicase
MNSEQTTLSFNPKLIISCVTKDKGPLTKIMSLNPETGQVIKDGSECSMHSGFIKQIPISSPEGFAKMLASRKENQALVHGVCKHKEARVVTKGKVGKVSSDIPVIARTKDYIAYSDGSGVILFDHDKARDGAVGSDEALSSYSPENLIKMLATVHPDIGMAAFVAMPSTSSCIYNQAGEMLRGEGTGSHTYLFVKHASDIPRYLKTLGKRLFLTGLGRIEISRSGSLLERTLVDLMVGSPERLDFVAGAVCRDGLEQRLPAPTVHDGEMLDTSTLPDLSPEEEQQYQKIVAALKVQAKPNQETVITKYIEREAGKLADRNGVSIEDARRIIVSRQDHILDDGDILFFAHQDAGVTVGAVLDAVETFHGKSLADPLEPDYEGGSKTKAKFYWNDGNPIIHSYAHGSGKYRFRRFVKEDNCAEEGKAREILENLVDRVADDCGVVYEPEVIEALARLKKSAKAEFMRLRAALKKANSDVILSELGKDISSCSRMGSKFKSPPPSPLSTLSNSYPALSPPLKEKVLHFRDALVRDGKRDDEQELCPQSEAASLLAGQLRGMFAYSIDAASWYRFEGTHWQESKQLAVDEATTALLYAGSGHLGFSNAYQNGVASLLTKGQTLSMGEAAGGILPFENGLLDLGEMKLSATTYEKALTWVLPFRYDHSATCPNFIDWLTTALDGDHETVKLLQAFINATLTGRPDLQRFLHLIGPAGTGKSTFGRLAFAIVGAANSTTTTLKQLEQNRFETAGIHGKRLVCIEEADKYGGSVSVLKAMTGQDPLRLERKNQQQSGNFIYNGQVLMMSNERLATTDYTSGIERRRVTVEFTRQITADERAQWDRRGGEEVILHAEIPGIINWALSLSRDEVTDSFRVMPQRVQRANLEAALFNNPLADWMVEHCIPDTAAKTQIGDGKQVTATTGERIYMNADERLYPNYLIWCQRSGREKVSLQRFSSHLIDAARQFGATIQKKRTGQSGTHFEGLRLRRDSEQPWRDRLSPPLVQDLVKDNYPKMLEVEEVEDFSTLSYTGKNIYPPSPSNKVTVTI